MEQDLNFVISTPSHLDFTESKNSIKIIYTETKIRTVIFWIIMILFPPFLFIIICISLCSSRDVKYIKINCNGDLLVFEGKGSFCCTSCNINENIIENAKLYEIIDSPVKYSDGEISQTTTIIMKIKTSNKTYDIILDRYDSSDVENVSNKEINTNDNIGPYLKYKNITNAANKMIVRNII